MYFAFLVNETKNRYVKLISLPIASLDDERDITCQGDAYDKNIDFFTL